MRLLILAAALAAPAGTPAAPPRAPAEAKPPALAILAPPGKTCRRPDVVLARPSIHTEAKPLGELPAGDLMLAVYNEIDGCMEPVVVRQGIGFDGRRR